MTDDENKDEVMRRVEPHLKRLQFEIGHLAWSPRSAEGMTAALAGLRDELGGEFVDTVVWFLAVLAARMRLPTDKEAAQLDFPLALHEELREFLAGQHEPGPGDVIH